MLSALLALCQGNTPIKRRARLLMPVMQTFDIFSIVSLNKLLSKQSSCKWFEQATIHKQICNKRPSSLMHICDASLVSINLTLNERAPSYLGLTKSISWLLMPWLLTSPGHQQPWYWLCRICRSFSSYSRKDFKYLCQINVEEWHKKQIYVYIPSEKI